MKLHEGGVLDRRTVAGVGQTEKVGKAFQARGTECGGSMTSVSWVWQGSER